MAHARPSAIDTAPGPQSKSLLIEGWRGINHSFALVNQNQILELLRLEGVTLFHRDLPFRFPTWNRIDNASGLATDDQQAIDALTLPDDADVACVYRIAAPFYAGAADDRRKTVTFMVTELGLANVNFENADADTSFFTRDDNFIVAPSHWARARIIDWGFAPDKVKIVPHGVDSRLFAPLTPAERHSNRLALGLADDDIVFMNVGLPTWNKGIDLLLLAFAKLRSEGRKVRLILKDQKDVYGLSVETMIRDLGAQYPDLISNDTLSSISVISTNLSRADLRVLYGVADCYVSPYRAEGFNLPVLEAIACGTRAIVTKGGATDDFCNDDVALRISGVVGHREDEATRFKGTFIEPDLGALVEAMDSIATRAVDVLPNFDTARRLVADTFTWQKAAVELARLTLGTGDIAATGKPDAKPAVVKSAFKPAGQADVTPLRMAETTINVALGKPASQSSVFAQQDQAGAAVSGVMPHDYAFHTDKEDSPWWQVDLGASYPIDAIIVHNRRLDKQERAQTIQIELAETPNAWMLIHAGFARFGAAGDGHPLTMPIGGALRGRYIRLSLRGMEYLHLAQVEVRVRRDLLALEVYRQRFGLAYFHAASTDFGRPYSIEIPPHARSDAIVGLKVNYCSRFGNLLQQYTHMIQLARNTGLKYIQLGRHALFDVKESFEVDGITFLPPEAPPPPDGAMITGSFFHSDTFVPALIPFLRFDPDDEVAYSAIAATYLRPHVLTGIPIAREQHFADELTIHIRSGDLFVGDQSGNLWYRQPPLSFYTLVIERMRASGTINRVRLVFEDRGNPCIASLEAWLDARRISYRTQCRTLHEDMSALIDAPHLVFGYGTFGYAACRLSKRIETLHYFTPELGGRYEHIGCIQTVVAVSDGKGDYIKAGGLRLPTGEWANTPEQRDMMVSYPAEYLKIETLKQAPDVPDAAQTST